MMRTQNELRAAGKRQKEMRREATSPVTRAHTWRYGWSSVETHSSPSQQPYSFSAVKFRTRVDSL